LAAIQITLAGARRSGQRGTLAAAVDAARQRLKAETENLRALITELQPPSLEELGVVAALEALADRTAGGGCEVDLTVDIASPGNSDRSPMEAELELAVYRIIQEALTNVTKHSSAKRAVVEVSESGTGVHVNVRDDGHGFDTSIRTNGFGLLMMRERAEMFSGSLQIQSGPNGTTISALIPTNGTS